MLQRRLEEVCEELRTTQSRNSSLQATLDKAQQDSGTLSGQKIGEQGLDGYQMFRPSILCGILIVKNENGK